DVSPVMSLICSAGGGDLGSPCVGDRFQVLITVFHNPEMFFCQRVHNAKQLGELVDAMNKRCRATTATLISLPEPGGVCCAQYTGDGKWYRASVLKHTSDDTALVGYLDFGNTETLHISALRPIDIDLLQTPFQAIQCRLAGVKPPSGSWSPEAIFAIGLVLMNKIFSALVISESAGALTLDLVAESSSPPLPVSQYLIAAGLAEDEKSPSVPNEGEEPREEPGEEPRETSSGLAWAQLALNKETEVMVCMLRSPGDFYCHIYNPT
ncbi:tudor domain-containing protein 1-like, partial [Mantella aurantiaca]